MELARVNRYFANAYEKDDFEQATFAIRKIQSEEHRELSEQYARARERWLVRVRLQVYSWDEDSICCPKKFRAHPSGRDGFESNSRACA
jgi:hypothetical protein